MKIATIDAETFWDTDYTLSRMSPLEYVMGDRFEAQLLSIKIDDNPTEVYFGNKIGPALAEFDWSKYAICGHNMSAFDSYILAYRYGIRPRLWLCTLAMARPIFEKTVGLGLAKLVEHFKLGVKDQTALYNTRGKRLVDFTAQELVDMAKYNRDDTDQCRALFKLLLPMYKSSELWQIDAITRMRTEPQFALDFPLLERSAADERARKRAGLLALAKKLEIDIVNIDDGEGDTFDNHDEVIEQVRTQLASAPKFSALLESLNVPVPMKASPTDPAKQIPALSKTDEEFIALQEHPDPVVSAAARARLDVKSTLLETRIQKFLTAGRLAGGRLPIPLRYCGAGTTGRDSGEEYNPQNMPRIADGKPKPSDALRASLRAPPGHKIIVADQSGIELRVNHFLWKVPFTMQTYAADPKADLYRAAGAAALGIAPEDLSKLLRQMEKVKALGLGFGAGGVTFQRIARVMGGIELTLEEAKQHVVDWRARHVPIVRGWESCGQALPWIHQGRDAPVDPWGLVRTSEEGFVLPSGRAIRYPYLRELDLQGVVQEFFNGVWPDLSDEQFEIQVRRKVGWWYGRGRHRARLTGPKANENVVQALARDTVFEAAVEFYKKTQLRPALRVHDELVYVVPEGDADDMLDTLQQIMRTPLGWWPELVVWSEGGTGDTYAEAK